MRTIQIFPHCSLDVFAGIKFNCSSISFLCLDDHGHSKLIFVCHAVLMLGACDDLSDLNETSGVDGNE